MIDIVDRLRFDAARCEATFSKGVAANITEAADRIQQLEAECNRWVEVSIAEDARKVAWRKALEGIAEFCSSDATTLGAIERLAHIRNTATTTRSP
jgi:hypothetical protein